MVAQNLPSIDKPDLASTYIPVNPLQHVAHRLHIPTFTCNKKYHSMFLPYLSKRRVQTQYTCNPLNSVSLQYWLSKMPLIPSVHEELLTLGKMILSH